MRGTACLLVLGASGETGSGDDPRSDSDTFNREDRLVARGAVFTSSTGFDDREDLRDWRPVEVPDGGNGAT